MLLMLITTALQNFQNSFFIMICLLHSHDIPAASTIMAASIPRIPAVPMPFRIRSASFSASIPDKSASFTPP